MSYDYADVAARRSATDLNSNPKNKHNIFTKGTIMYRNIFIAWYCLSICVLSLTTFLILMPSIGVGRACSVGYAWTGFLGFTPLFPYIVFPKEQYDERDLLFLQRALFAGLCFGFAMIGPVIATLGLAHHWASSISMDLIGLPFSCGTFIAIFSFAVVLLYSYYKGGHIEHGGQPHE